MVLTDISDALREGKAVSDASLINGFSDMDKAREVYESFNTGSYEEIIKSHGSVGTDEVKAKRQVEEIRLMMIVEANFSLIQKGMEIDTAPLSEIVDALKELEQSLPEQREMKILEFMEKE